MDVWFIGIAAVAILLSSSWLVVGIRTRPDRKLRRQLRACAERIHDLTEMISFAEREIAHFQSEEYLDALRAHGGKHWSVNVGHWYCNEKFPASEAEAEQMRQSALEYAKDQISQLRLALRGHRGEWKRLVSHYRAQFAIAPSRESLAAEMARRHANIGRLESEIAEQKAIRARLALQLQELDTGGQHYREMPRVPKVRVVPEVEEVEELIARIDREERKVAGS